MDSKLFGITLIYIYKWLLCLPATVVHKNAKTSNIWEQWSNIINIFIVSMGSIFSIYLLLIHLNLIYKYPQSNFNINIFFFAEINLFGENLFKECDYKTNQHGWRLAHGSLNIIISTSGHGSRFVLWRAIVWGHEHMALWK